MAVENLKISSLTFDDERADLASNITGEWTDVYTYTVPQNRIVLPFDGRDMYVKLTGSEEFTGTDVDGSTVTLGLGNFDPVETPQESESKYVSAWVDGSSDGWQEVPVTDVDTSTDEITLDTSGVAGSSQDVYIYAQFRQGQGRFYVQKPSGGSVRKASLHTFNVGKMHQRNFYKPDQAPTLARTLPIIENSRFILAVKTKVSLAWDLDHSDHPNNAAKLEIPAAFGRMDQVGENTVREYKQIFSGV